MPAVTDQNIKEFTQLYYAAKVNGDTQFKFKGEAVLVSWAKHVIDYFAQKGYGEPDRDE